MPTHEGRTDWLKIAEMHKLARLNDGKAKEQARLGFNEHMRAKECKLEVGDQVLFKLFRNHKTVSEWDPDPFKVVEINGSMITASRLHPKVQKLTRNSSFFKLFYEDADLELNVTKPFPEPPVIDVPHFEQRLTSEIELTNKRTPTAHPIENTQVSNEHILEREVEKPAAKRGRKNKAESVVLDNQRQINLEAARLANPPTRSSSRLALKQSEKEGR